MIIYVITAIGALWGLLTFISLREEEKEIQEMLKSARKATEERRELK